MPAEWVESSLLRWIVFAPLLMAVVSGTSLALFRRPLSRGLVVWGACGSVATSFAISAVAFGSW